MIASIIGLIVGTILAVAIIHAHHNSTPTPKNQEANTMPIITKHTAVTIFATAATAALATAALATFTPVLDGANPRLQNCQIAAHKENQALVNTAKAASTILSALATFNIGNINYAKTQTQDLTTKAADLDQEAKALCEGMNTANGD